MKISKENLENGDVKISFEGTINMAQSIILPESEVKKLVDLLLKDEDGSFDSQVK